MIMMNEGITMKPVHTPQSVPPPLPLMFVPICAGSFPHFPAARRARVPRGQGGETRTGTHHGRFVSQGAQTNALCSFWEPQGKPQNQPQISNANCSLFHAHFPSTAPYQ